MYTRRIQLINYGPVEKLDIEFPSKARPLSQSSWLVQTVPGRAFSWLTLSTEYSRPKTLFIQRLLRLNLEECTSSKRTSISNQELNSPWGAWILKKTFSLAN